MKKNTNVSLLFFRYVSQNILGMLGISAYVLADTFFISKAEGAAGITALNLVLPVYSVMFAIGSMIGVGSATRFNLLRARNDSAAEDYFSNAVVFAGLISLLFVLTGLLAPGKLLELLGADAEILNTGISYTRIFMVFAPFFMWNYIWNAFIRNDGAPSLAMAATLSSSLFNIVMDYVFMFPLGLGIKGAALATGISPIIGIAVCSLHFFSGENTIRFRIKLPSLGKLFHSCQLGVAAFVGEISSGVITFVFNTLLLRLAGNVGVAAYGVVANTAIVATSIFNGVSLGAQPLLSDFYGKGDKKSVKKVFRLALMLCLLLALVMLYVSYTLAEPIIGVFNSEHNQEMAAYAMKGMKIYFIGFFFAGVNIAGTGYLSATEAAFSAFLTSVMRGFVFITGCAFLLAQLFGINGVWAAFPAAEFLSGVVIFYAVWKTGKNVRKS